MKKGILLVLGLVAAMLIDSCTPGELEFETISTAPSIKINAPGTVTAGSSTALTVTVTDGEVSPLAEGTITLKSGNTVISTNKQTATGGSLTLSIAGSVVAALNPGTYKLEVSAKDNANQTTTASADIAISCEALASCKAAGKTTVIVITPAVTPADAKVGLIGSLTGWGSDIVLTKIANNCYCAAVEFSNGTEFKFRRSQNAAGNPDWTYVEKGATCNELDNRKQDAAADKTVTFTVLNWRNTGTCPD